MLTFNSPPNFEAPGDVGANNVYEVQVTVTDSDTQTAMQNLQVTVTDATEAPSITSAAAVSVPENQTAVIDVQSTDPDGDTEGAGLTYSLTGGADQLLFSIVPGTGVLTFNSPPNFEAPGDVGANNVYEVQVTVTDSDTLTGMQNLQVTVTDTNEAPSITSAAAVSVPENQTAVIDVQSIDPDGDTEGAGLTYSLGGVDQALFSIVPATGVLTFNSPPNFEAPGDVGANNVYDVQITVTDSDTLTGVQNLQVTVTDANEPPSITSAAAVSVPENQTAVIDVQSTDPDGDTEGAGLTYSLGGVDQALFSIVPATGVLTFNSPPNFEAPGDAGANNVYDVQITVTDSDTLTGVQNLQVTVTDANEAPSITSAAAVSVPENQTAVIDVQSIDPDGDTEGAGLTYSLGGVDQALFSIVPATGVLTFNSPPNFEAPGDAGANNVYDVQVTVTDSDTLTGVQNLQVTVTDANEAPSITSAAAVSVPENQTAVIDVQSIDPDGDTEGAGLTYSLGGVDQALFSIVPATGVLTFNSPPNFEAPGDAGANNVYDVQITVTDSDTLTGVQNLQVTVTDANEAPSITSAAAVSVPENQTAAIDVQSIDPDGDTEGAGLTYSLGGVDQALFSIVPATGVLTFNSPPNFEAPGDAGANNVYDVQVTVTDSDTLTGVQNLQVTVTNVNEPPTANPDTANITEEAPNVAAANTVSGNVLANDTDPELVPLTVSAVAGGSVGSPRAGTYGSVTINSNGSFTYTLDDTNPAVNALQPGGMLTDSFGYTAFDGSFTSSSTLMVTIHGADDPATPDNDAHDFIGNTQLEVDRDTASTPEVIANTPPAPPALGVLDGDIDPDGGSPITIAGIVGCVDLTAPFDCVLPGQGTVSLQADGSFSFVPEPGDTDPTASFQYTLVGNPTPATVTLTRFERVWYVDPTAAAGGNGTSVLPFNAFTSINGAGGAGDSDFAGDYIFVHDGSLAGSIELEANQRLIGEGVELSIPVSLNGNGSPTSLRPAGTQPQVTNAGGNTVTVTGAVPVEIRGLSLASNTANAIDLTSAAALTGSATLTISDNEIRGAGAEGVDINLNAGTTGTLAIDFTNNTWDLAGTHTGNGFDARTAAAAANLRVNFSNNTNVLSTGASAVVIDGSGGGSLIITGFANNSVHQNTAGSGMLITSAKFDSNAATAAYDQVSGGTTVVGISGNGVGGAGVNMSTVSGDLAFTDLDIFADGGAGLRVAGTGLVNTGAGTGTRVTVGAGVAIFEATGGPAVDVSNATVDLQPTSIRSTNSPTTGVSLVNVADGTTTAVFSAGSTSTITNATGTDFNLDGGNATVSYAGPINNTAGRSVVVQNRTADSATFTGAITDTGTGILLSSNTGSTISFTAALALTTGANDAFTATGGGTVTATDTTSTITTTTGIGLNVANTTIGATGLRFRSISAGTGASGPANGIVLNATGALGSLTVTGTGAADSGGTIQNTTSHGVSLTNTLSPSFTRMRIQNTAGSGIEGTQVTNFTFANGTIDNSGTGGGADDSNLAFNAQAAGTENNLSGTVTITNNTLTNSRWHGIMIQNFNGTLADAIIMGNTITSSTSAAASLGYGINLQILGSATTVSNLTKATISGNTVTNFPSAGGIQVQGGNSNAAGPAGVLGVAGSGAANVISIVNNQVRGQSAANRMATSAILYTVSGKGQGNVDISTNGTLASPIGNNIGTTIGVGANGNTTLTATTNNNFVRAQPSGYHRRLRDQRRRRRDVRRHRRSRHDVDDQRQHDPQR